MPRFAMAFTNKYTLYTDACLFGMGFWSPSHSLAFQHSISPTSTFPIFYWEAYAVLSAFTWIVNYCHPSPQRVVIYTDNTNTVDMFNTLRATPLYNPIIMTAVEVMMSSGTQLRVAHIPGEANTIADSLSRFMNIYIRSALPHVDIHTFQPPHLLLGADFL